MIRWFVLSLVVALSVVVVVVDRQWQASVVADIEVERVVNPSLSENPALDTTWFCPSGSSDVDGVADHQVAVSNLSDQPAQATISVLTAEGPVPPLRISLPPFGSDTRNLAELSSSKAAGAIVQVVGGEGVVGHTVTTANGVAQGNCSTQVSPQWYFAGGRDSSDTAQYLTLMNPFDDDAVFDIEFRIVGRAEPRRPEALQGRTLAGRSVVRINLNDELSAQADYTTTITTRRGQLVAERMTVIDGSLGPAGTALQLGVTDPAQSWIFPVGRLNETGADEVFVWNPSESVTSTVKVGFWPNDPEDRSRFGFVSVERDLGPGRFEVIDMLAEAANYGLELPYEVGVTILAEGAPVIAERWHYGEGYAEESPEGEDDPPAEEDAANPEADTEAAPDSPQDPSYAQPTATTGVATSRGIEIVARRWAIPWAIVDGAQLVITSADAATVTVQVQADGQFLTEETEISVQSRSRQLVDLTTIAPNGSVVVTATSDIAVGLQITSEDGSIDIVPGVPSV